MTAFAVTAFYVSQPEPVLTAEPPQPVEPVKPEPRKPAPVPESAMPELARSWLKNYLEDTLWNAPSIERVKVRIGDVLRQPADPKKVACSRMQALPSPAD
jgi:hypothetical protein